jgi:hypothetical protein
LTEFQRHTNAEKSIFPAVLPPVTFRHVPAAMFADHVRAVISLRVFSFVAKNIVPIVRVTVHLFISGVSTGGGVM